MIRSIRDRLAPSADRLAGQLSPTWSAHLRYWRVRGRAMFGRESWTGLNELDRRLVAYLPVDRPGTFVEAGAHDGVQASNTWWLERRGWRGLLVEPEPRSAALCRRFRRSPVVECALGSFEQEGGQVTLHFGGLMTAAEGADPSLLAGGTAAAHAALGLSVSHAGKAGTIVSTVRSLSAVLDEHRLSHVDVLSLDVEGYEVPVLKGIDFARHHFGHILVETESLGAVREVLGPAGFELVAELSSHDYLFAATPDRAR